MATWWHHSQQQHTPHHHQQQTNESFDYPSSTQPMVPSHFHFYDPSMIMVEGNTNDEYLMHTTNNANPNETNSIDYHTRRPWYNG